MSKVLSLKSLSLRVVADFVWDALKSRSTPLEPTLGVNTGLTTLKQLIEYLDLPTSLKLELAHVLSTQYDNSSLFQMMLTIEMGFHHFNFQHYLHLNGNLRLINLLKSGKKSLKRLILFQCMENCLACNRFTSIQFLIQSFPYLQELLIFGTFCNDYTFSLVAKYCPHLKTLKVRHVQGIADQGIEFLCSPQSVAKQLVYLSFWDTNVTAKGAENALKHLTCLESLECSNDMDTVGLLKSLLEQELVFVRYKEMSLTFTRETENIHKCKNLVHKLPLIFPNLCNITIKSYVFIEPECLLFLRSLSKIEKLTLEMQCSNASMSLFPCDNYHPQMSSLTNLSLSSLENVCIHTVLDGTPSLQYLTIRYVTDSGCTHNKPATLNSSVLHLALIENDETVVEKCLDLCPSIRTLALIDQKEMQLMINSENSTNLTHLSLNFLLMDTAEFLVRNFKNLQVLNLTLEEPVSKEAVVWFQRHSPFVKVVYYYFNYAANWFEDEKFSPCDLCQAYESYPKINNSHDATTST